MANRYWVGGAGTWNATNTANWSSTSGGAGGASVPTSADDVFLDANSGVGDVLIGLANMTIKSLNCTSYTGSFSSNDPLNIAGSLTWGAGMYINFTGTINIVGNGSVICNGQYMAGPLTINGSGITVTLGDAFYSSSPINVDNGTFDTAGYAVTASRLNSTSSLTRAILLRASAISLVTSGITTDISNVSTLTFNAGTSTITCTSNGAKSIGNTDSANTPITYYNVTSSGSGGLTLTNTNVFNSVTVSNSSGPSIYTLQTNSDQTIGTLNLNGNAPTQRVAFKSTVFQTPRTIALTSFGTSINCDFSDIVITGAASGASITRAGNLGGNSGIGFPAPKTVYWNLAGTNGYAANGWATTSGGTPDVNNFPLAQDTAVIDNNSAGTGLTSYGALFTLGTLNMSSRTTAFNISFTSGSVQFMGSFLCGTGITFTTSVNTSIIFVGFGSSALQSNGRSINHDVAIACRTGGSVTLSDALSLNNAGCSLFVDSGSFNSAGYSITIGTLTANRTSSTRAITLGSSAVTIIGTGTTAFNLNNAGLTFSGATSSITFTGTTATTFAGNNNTFGTVTIAGGAAVGDFTITGSNTFDTLTSTRTAAYILALTAGTTQTFTTFAVSGSAGKLVTLKSTTTSQATISRPTAWTVGANSVNVGNNTGLSFTGSNPDYLSVSYIRGIITIINTNTNFLSMF